MKVTIEKFEEKVDQILDGEKLDSPPKYLLAKALKRFRFFHQNKSEELSILNSLKTKIARLVPEQDLIMAEISLRGGSYRETADKLGQLRYKFPDGKISLEIGDDSVWGDVSFESHNNIEGLCASIIDETSGSAMETHTDNDGYFDFFDIPPGKYYLQIKSDETQEIIIEDIIIGVDDNEFSF